jgi:hypothetical protein
MTIRQAAESLGVKYNRVWYAVRLGHVQARRIGPMYVLDDDAVAALRRLLCK